MSIEKMSVMNRVVCVSAAALGLGATAASADVSIVFSFNDVESRGQEENPVNTILSDYLNATEGYHVSNISWDLTLTTVGASFASDAVILVRDGSMDRLVFLRPAFGEDNPVNEARYTGSMDLTAMGEDFSLATDGLLLEFYEQFDDNPSQADAYWSGTVSFNVPAPGGLGLVLGGLAVAGRRRR